jgi:hypothetical protein
MSAVRIQFGIAGTQDGLALVDRFDDRPARIAAWLRPRLRGSEPDHRSLSGRGVSFVGQPACDAGGPLATMTDPDENRISLRQPGSQENLVSVATVCDLAN